MHVACAFYFGKMPNNQEHRCGKCHKPRKHSNKPFNGNLQVLKKPAIHSHGNGNHAEQKQNGQNQKRIHNPSQMSDLENNRKIDIQRVHKHTRQNTNTVCHACFISVHLDSTLYTTTYSNGQKRKPYCRYA